LKQELSKFGVVNIDNNSFSSQITNKTFNMTFEIEMLMVWAIERSCDLAENYRFQPIWDG